ncbi:MAG TPA: lamin tail domain-containing protein, partial [Verrucomicrobiae bacterium]|nr:lamin tail domain-containing protein [Verrucomicrobiae bacterium]
MKFVVSIFAIAIAIGVLSVPSVMAADSVVVFNEVHYHPSTNESVNEWIELHNQMAIDIDLSAWSVQGGVDFTFTEGTIIPGGGYLVVASDPAVLRSGTGLTNVVGPFSGRLNNSSARLELRDRNDRLMDRFDYGDEGKWPIAPDGSGATLVKADSNSPSDAPEFWTSSVLVDGTPGARNFPRAPLPLRRTLIPFDSLWRFEASGSDLGTAWRSPAFNDSGWSGQNAATLISYWPFDGNAAATRGTAGSLVGAVAGAADRNGSANGALAFTGTLSQYVSVAGGGGLNAAAQGTISLWVRWSGLQDADCCGTFGAVLARQANGLFSDDILALNAADPASGRIVWRQSGGPAPILITGTTAVGTSWHHVVVTFSPGGSTLYVDGTPQGTATGTGLNNNPATPLSIGAWASDGGGFSTSSIDDVAVWDKPLSAAQVAMLAAQTKTPLDFAQSETAVFYSGDGRLATNDELRKTALPAGPTTYYFRTAFLFGDNPSATELKLDMAVDDGAVVYLNGSEVHRQNMPAGPVSYGTLASSAVGAAPLVSGITIPTGQLMTGTNVVAVEVHQAAGDPGMVFGAGLNAVITPVPPLQSWRMISVNDGWKFDASNVAPPAAWRTSAFDDSGWSNGLAVFYGGDGVVDGFAPEVVQGVLATATTQYAADGRLAIRAVDGSGLVGNAHVTTPAGTMWLNNGTFTTPNDLNPSILFDLGATQSIRSMKIWNYNEFLPGRPELLGRGVAQCDVLTGTATNALTSLITGQALAMAPGTQTDFSQTIDLGGVQTRYVKLDKLTNFPGGDLRFVGLSEVQFLRDVDVRRSQLPLGVTTYYFRKNFSFAGDPAGATLALNVAVDDGAIVYLNGVEVRRLNMPAGAVGHATPALTAIGRSAFAGPVVIPAASLVPGMNVLAVEVHQSMAGGDADAVFGATLDVTVPPLSPAAVSPGTVVFNEIAAGGGATFQIELVNRGADPVPVGGYVIRRTGASPDAEFVLPAQTVSAGGFVVLNQASLGFVAIPGDKLFLLLPGRRGVADAVEVHGRSRARWPDGTGEFLTPNSPTLGSANSFTFHDEIVFNEIFYHGPPTLEVPPTIAPATNLFFTNFWRYEQSGTDLGTAWREPGYDDSSWPVGQGLFYNTAAALPAPKNTPLVLGPTTYYFRTSLLYTGTPAIVTLNLRHIMDDAIVVYVNGNEVHRANVSASAVIRYTNFANTSIATATLRPPVAIPLTNLVIGTNIIAAEVHQALVSGDDVVFGLELNGTIEAAPRISYSASPEEWVELHNRSGQRVDLAGWRIDGGIDFRFGTNDFIPAGGYLV